MRIWSRIGETSRYRCNVSKWAGPDSEDGVKNWILCPESTSKSTSVFGPTNCCFMNFLHTTYLVFMSGFQHETEQLNRLSFQNHDVPKQQTILCLFSSFKRCAAWSSIYLVQKAQMENFHNFLFL